MRKKRIKESAEKLLRAKREEREAERLSETMSQTAKQAKAFALAVQMIADAIREANQIPSGHLYAMVMGVLSLDTYTTILGQLKGAGLIEEKYHELFWIG